MGIIHRDIKPDNILIEKSKKTQKIIRIKLSDFGFSKTVIPGETLSRRCGTPAFIAPEILEQKGYGKKVDLWSAGVIFYYLVCKDVPFHSNDRQNLYKAIQTDELDTTNHEFCRLRSITQDLIK